MSLTKTWQSGDQRGFSLVLSSTLLWQLEKECEFRNLNVGDFCRTAIETALADLYRKETPK